jgi:hypothetical protein
MTGCDTFVGIDVQAARDCPYAAIDIGGRVIVA